MRVFPDIPRAVRRKLGHYVYLYVNPLDNSIFYVGKGRGQRALAHLDNTDKREVAKIIRRIRKAGKEPLVEILAHGLPSEKVAFQVESAVIDALGVAGLANIVRGWRSRKLGRTPLRELVAQYTRKRASIREPSILIRISHAYEFGMTDSQLYDATRSGWKVGATRERAEYAFAVFEGVIKEVYRISSWVHAGTTFNHRYSGRAKTRPGRWEFVGVIAEEKVRRRYLDRFVGHLFSRGAANPISYVNIQ